MPPNETQRDIYRMVQENNRMLHAMRRSAFWGGLIRFVVYAALLAAPIWFYLSYMAPVMDRLVGTMQQIQGGNQQSRSQFSAFEDMVNTVRDKFAPASSSATSTR